MVLLVDGNNLVNAAFYVAQARADETNTEEIQKNTVNIFKSQIGKLQNDFSPSKIFIAWDGRNGAKWRKEILPEYKGGRNKEGKEKLFEALDICREIDYHNNFHHEDYEADDIIYALCRSMRGEKTIISADKDFLTLAQIDQTIRVYNPISKKFREIPDHCVICEKAIVGDKSDGIKGIQGIGIKKFLKMNGDYSILSKNQKEIFKKNVLIIDLSKNPKANEIYQFVKNKL